MLPAYLTINIVLNLRTQAVVSALLICFLIKPQSDAFSPKEGMRMSENNSNHFTFPIWLKTTLTITEAAEYSNIGINKIEGVGNIEKGAYS